MPCARSRRGSTTTLYCLTKPPTLATSATPSALDAAKRTTQSCSERSSARVMFLGDDRVLVDPADAGRVRPEARRHARRQAARCRVEVFEHAAAGPVGVGAVLEDHVDERHAEEREAAHDLRLGHRQHRRGQRIGDLVLDDLRRLPRIVGVDDDLHVGEVGDGVERQRAQGIEAGGDGE